MKRFKSIILAGLAVFVAAAYILPATQTSAVTSSAALSIVPKKNYTIEPGKTVTDKLTIRNIDSERPLELSLRVVDFTYTDNGGTPKLMLAEDAPQTTWSLKPFINIPKKVRIEPDSSKSVDMSVAIPAKHGAGSYYSAIVYSSGASDGGNVGLSASGVTLVFTSIPGDVKEDLKLTKFGAYQLKEQSYSYFNASPPESIGYTLKNNGNVTASPAGSITMKHIFGKEQIITNVNPSQSLALIGQERTFTSCIKLKSEEVEFNGDKQTSNVCAKPALIPGYYSLDLNLLYGQNGSLTKEVTGAGGFWYLPWWFVLVALVIILVVVFYSVKTYRSIQSKLYGSKPKRRSRRK